MKLKPIHTLDFSQRGTAGWLEALDRACREWGCFQLRGHDLDSDLCAKVLSEMEGFFELSQEDKLSVERTAENPWGFYDRELTKNVRDWKQIFDIGPASNDGPFSGASTPWPSQLDGFRIVMETYYAASESLALKLLADIGECLGVKPGTLERGFGERQSSFLRLNYYPPCADPDHHLGISHHTDAGALTILLPDTQPGLQFLLGKSWHTVIPEADALIVNIGDIVQVWSNDTYRAPLHRVQANARHSRFSAPFFLNPSYDTVYAPLPSVLKHDEPRYRPINWGEFRAGRAAGDYADAGAEIQITDFRR